MSDHSDDNLIPEQRVDTNERLGCTDKSPAESSEERVTDDLLVPEVVEIRLDYTKDAVQMAKGGCRRWK
jgi:hypothetical protein